ncbi:MAG: glycosyltransferase family 4 protein [Chlamydiia bacterium]|nr:glycosyltransferase family 4 protein [Chlamydiia bacterium]
MNPNAIRVCLQTRHINARGGLEKWARLIANGFAKKGADVHILTSDVLEQKGFHPSIKPHTLSPTKLFSYRQMKGFDALCKKWNKDHTSDIVFGIDRTSEQTHIRAGNGVHASFLEKRKEFEGYSSIKELLNPLNRTILDIEKKAFENPHLKVLFTNSHMVKNEILKYYQVPSDKIEVIHNGLEWKEMGEDHAIWVEKKPKIAAKLGLDPSLFHFLFIGNGYKRKGLPLLLKALKLLHPSDFHLSVVGKDRNIHSFISLAQKLGLSNHVSFFGPCQNVRPFYQVADCLTIPSIYDPFANVTIEALGMGLFVVSSTHNGGYEVLKEETGTAIKELSSLDAIKEALQFAMRFPKTWIRSQIIRKSVEHLDLSNQLTSMIDISLENR